MRMCRAVAGLAAGGLIAVLTMLAPAKSALAHPHAWIDLRIAVLFDARGHVTGLRQTWLFDEFYTAFALEGLARDPRGAPSADDVQAIVAENMKNLEDYGYFTSVTQGEAEVGLDAIRDVSANYRDGRLDMTFTYAFAKPVSPATAPLRYAIADPTYYIEMLHVDAADAIRLEGSPAGCRHRLIEPQPTMEAVGLAAALDRTQSGGDGLGALFAQTVVIQCK